MTLTEKVDHDLHEAMKARDIERLGTLRMLKSAFQYASIEKSGARAVLDDETAISVLRKQIKQREDASSLFNKGGRLEQAEKEIAEITLLSSYLPAQLSPEELAIIVKEAITEINAPSIPPMGSVIKIVKAKVAGRADGKSISDAVKTFYS